MPPCQNTGRVPGVEVEVASKAAGMIVCTLGSRTDVRHTVRVTSLRRYPATVVRCDGAITSNPRKVQFDQTPDTWTASTRNLPPNYPYEFDTATLLRDFGGTEAVHAHVTVTWKRPGSAGKATVVIDVTA